MKNKGTGIQWHRIFEIAALMSVIVLRLCYIWTLELQ